MFDKMMTRRSIRAYEDKPVPRELLEKLITAAQYSASAGNLQPWHFYIIQSKTIMEKMFTACLLGTPSWQLTAPACIVVTAEPETSSQRYGDRGQYLYCLQDTAIATTNMQLLAHDMGLGSCWIGAFDDEKCAKTLGIPDKRIPVAILTVGYAERVPDAPPRRELQDITTWIG